MKFYSRIGKVCLSMTLAAAMMIGSTVSAFAADNQSYVSLRETVKALNGKITWDKAKEKIVFELNNGDYVYDYKNDVLTLEGIALPKSNIVLKQSQMLINKAFLDDSIQVDGEIKEGKLLIEPLPMTLESTTLTSDQKLIQDKLKTYMAFEAIDYAFEGQVLIAKGNDIYVHNAYGDADIITGDNATILDTYAIGSVTKQLTAFAVIHLQEQGKLNFDDKVTKYLKDVPNGDKITLDMLLSHTSGLYEYSEELPNFAWDLSYDEVIKLLKDKPLNFEPGTEWSYSNTGYYLLGKVVETISGQSLEEYLKVNAFDKLKMDQTQWGLKDGKFTSTTLGSYNEDAETVRHLDQILLGIAGGAGSVISSVDDLYLWQKALYGGELMSDASLLTMEGLTEAKRVNPNYGYGLINAKTPFSMQVGHGGNTLGFTANTVYLKDQDIHVVLLTNKGYYDLNKITQNIVAIFEGKEVATNKPKYVEMSEEALKAFEGKFQITTPITLGMTMFVKEGFLWLQGDGQMPIKMNALDKDTFVDDSGAITIKFDRVTSPTQLTLYQAGAVFIAKKTN